MQFTPLADELGFIYVFPDWLDLGATGPDHQYLHALTDEIKTKYNVDPTRTFIIGHSAGGALAFTMACERAKTIAAIATLAPGAGSITCSTEPLHVLVIHGTADEIVPFSTGETTVSQWITRNACAPAPDESPPPLDLTTQVPGTETRVARYTEGCVEGGSVEFWTMQNGQHIPELSASFSRSVIDFLFAHSKTDCNGNGVLDEDEITNSAVSDCDENGVPDECGPDCNGNGVPNDCDIAAGTSSDCDSNGFPDECDQDCDGNGVPDSCEVMRDLNANGIPDACELHLFGDLDLDGDADLADYLALLQCIAGPGVRPPRACCRGNVRGGPCDSPADLDGDGDVDLTDAIVFQASFTGSR